MESLNLTLTKDVADDLTQTIKHLKVTRDDEGEIQMSKEEMLQYIESQKRELRYLQ